MLQETDVKVDSKYTPTFLRNQAVILIKDCKSYTPIYAIDDQFFKKDRICLVIECGLSHFYVDEENKLQDLVEDCEWCKVNAILEKSEDDSNDEDYSIGGVVRVKDLRKYIDDDI